ncbi:MAG: carboxypeptidase M32, partial [Fibrobacteres bacterium]|nr:carboxypeptidase M32 [Fibrobacterota bacterium]
ELVNDSSLSATQQLQVREAKRELDRSTKLPEKLVSEFSRATSLAHADWIKARETENWNLFKAPLQTIVNLSKEAAAYLGFEKDPYAERLDAFEPGCTTAQLDAVFTPLKKTLPEMVRKCIEKKRPLKREFYNNEFPVAGQEALCQFISKEMGLPETRSRMDISVHPFCTSFGLNDVRRTLRYHPNMPAQSLYSIMHENGHALYELGISQDLANTPCGSAVSLGIHESQSRLWENIIGRNFAFVETYFNEFKRFWGKGAESLSPPELYALITEVAPSYIRVEADELTYNLHIILRYELEKAIFDGSLSLDDLPEAWNTKFEEYFGLKVDKPSNGVLQDVHWSFGMFGYFPTYTLGNLYSAQLAHALEKKVAPIETLIREKRLSEVRTWLLENVHSFGKLKTAEQIAVDATGEKLNALYFERYLNKKYSS